MSAIRDRLFDALGARAYYGWTILAVAGLGLFASGPGQSHTFSVFVGPIGEDLGLSKSAIAIAYGAATLVAALLLPRMGRLVDRHGPRRMMLIVSLALGLFCLTFGAVGGIVTLTLPALVMSGHHDRVFRVAEDIDELAALLPEPHRVEFPNAGHLIPIERPAQFAQALMAFANRIG